MKLKSLNKQISLLILLILFTPVNAEDEIDIWNKEIKENSQIKKLNNSKKKIGPETISNERIQNNTKIENEILNFEDVKIFGIYDPGENNFNLNMWTQTEGEKIKSSFKRINKIPLSNIATNIFENNTCMSPIIAPHCWDRRRNAPQAAH